MLDAEDFEELLESHRDDLRNEELIEQQQQREPEAYAESPVLPALTTQNLHEILSQATALADSIF